MKTKRYTLQAFGKQSYFFTVFTIELSKWSACRCPNRVAAKKEGEALAVTGYALPLVYIIEMDFIYSYRSTAETWDKQRLVLLRWLDKNNSTIKVERTASKCKQGKYLFLHLLQILLTVAALCKTCCHKGFMQVIKKGSC